MQRIIPGSRSKDTKTARKMPYMKPPILAYLPPSATTVEKGPGPISTNYTNLHEWVYFYIYWYIILKTIHETFQRASPNK